MSDSLRPHGLQPTTLFCLWNSLGKNTGVGSLSLLQGIFPIQGSKLVLPLCRQILYHLNHQRSPRILEWGGSSQLRDQLGSPALQVNSSPAELPGRPQNQLQQFSDSIFTVFYIQYHVVCKQSFSSFPIWIPFISFSSLIASVGSSD